MKKIFLYLLAIFSLTSCKMSFLPEGTLTITHDPEGSDSFLYPEMFVWSTRDPVSRYEFIYGTLGPNPSHNIKNINESEFLEEPLIDPGAKNHYFEEIFNKQDISYRLTLNIPDSHYSPFEIYHQLCINTNQKITPISLNCKINTITFSGSNDNISLESFLTVTDTNNYNLLISNGSETWKYYYNFEPYIAYHAKIIAFHPDHFKLNLKIRPEVMVNVNLKEFGFLCDGIKGIGFQMEPCWRQGYLISIDYQGNILNIQSVNPFTPSSLLTNADFPYAIGKKTRSLQRVHDDTYIAGINDFSGYGNRGTEKQK